MLDWRNSVRLQNTEQTWRRQTQVKAWIKTGYISMLSPAFPAAIGNFRGGGVSWVNSKQLPGNLLQLWTQGEKCKNNNQCNVKQALVTDSNHVCVCVFFYRDISLQPCSVCTVCTEDNWSPPHSLWPHTYKAVPQNHCSPWNTSQYDRGMYAGRT